MCSGKGEGERWTRLICSNLYVPQRSVRKLPEYQRKLCYLPVELALVVGVQLFEGSVHDGLVLHALCERSGVGASRRLSDLAQEVCRSASTSLSVRFDIGS